MTIEPAKETEPTRIVNAVATRTNFSMSSPASVDLDDLVQLEQGDQGGRAAADAVEQRDHLRHLGHLDAAGAEEAARRPDRDRDQDQRHVLHVVDVEERDRAGEDRGAGADQVARRGRSWGRTGP